MPRTPRRNVPGFVYHLISRFVDREWFITSEEERARYLTLLGRAITASDWRCVAFGVMSNHIHLGVIAGTQPLSTWLRRAHSPFASWMNERHDRIGSMFVRGPKDHAVAPHRVCELIAYIHNNPVRAGVVEAARATSWTSHRAYLGLMQTPPWLDVNEGLARSGFADRDAFDRWVCDPAACALYGREIEAEVQFGSATSRVQRVTRDQETASNIVRATAMVLDVPVTQLRSPRKGFIERAGREIAIRCAAQMGVASLDIAAALAISQQGESAIRLRNRQSAELGGQCARVLELVSAPGCGARGA